MVYYDPFGDKRSMNFNGKLFPKEIQLRNAVGVVELYLAAPEIYGTALRSPLSLITLWFFVMKVCASGGTSHLARSVDAKRVCSRRHLTTFVVQTNCATSLRDGINYLELMCCTVYGM